MDFWGRRCGPYIYALHFCLSLGLLTGPFLIEPLAQTHVPEIVQHLALPSSHSINNSSLGSAVAPKYLDHYHKIVKREVLAYSHKNYNHSKHESQWNNLHPNPPTYGLEQITPDPLLLKLFASSSNGHKG